MQKLKLSNHRLQGLSYRFEEVVKSQPPSILLAKRDSTLEKHLGVYGFHDFLEPSPLIAIGWEILELGKGLIIWVA